MASSCVPQESQVPDEAGSWQTWVTNADIVKQLQEVTAATTELRASMLLTRDLMIEQQEQHHMMHREVMMRLDRLTDTGRFQIQTAASSTVAVDAGWGLWNAVPMTALSFPWPPEQFKEWGLAGEKNCFVRCWCQGRFFGGGQT